MNSKIRELIINESINQEFEDNMIIIKGAKHHNLKNISLKLPKNKLIVFTGVSGSGKSSLVSRTLEPLLENLLNKADNKVEHYSEILGYEDLDKVINVSQDPNSQRVYYKVEHMDMINQNIWRKLIEFWDFTPSWQNSIESINQVSDTFIYSIVYFDDMIVGYGFIDIKTGDIPQLAVDKNYRHKGIGKSIVTDLINNTESNKISILNVDGKCESMKDFLIKSAFESKIKQYEMSLDL